MKKGGMAKVRLNRHYTTTYLSIAKVKKNDSIDFRIHCSAL